jgi:hypothetical protein
MLFQKNCLSSTEIVQSITKKMFLGFQKMFKVFLKTVHDARKYIFRGLQKKCLHFEKMSLRFQNVQGYSKIFSSSTKIICSRCSKNASFQIKILYSFTFTYDLVFNLMRGATFQKKR